MVRAAVSASQASLERPGSAPAPFSAFPQAEPRPKDEQGSGARSRSVKRWDRKIGAGKGMVARAAGGRAGCGPWRGAGIGA